MKKLLERSRYLVVIAVVASLVAAVAAFGWGAVETILVVGRLVTAELDGRHEVAVSFIQLMDTFLIATGLVIFALGLYELFVGELELPEWLRLHDLHDLKARLGSIIILVMVVAFLEHLVEWTSASDTLRFGGAVAVVAAVLIAFTRFAENR